MGRSLGLRVLPLTRVRRVELTWRVLMVLVDARESRQVVDLITG